jgi:hypothetical protein
LISIRGDVCDELLGSKRKKAGQTWVGLRWRRKASFGKIVVGHSIRNLKHNVKSELVAERNSLTIGA